MDRPTLPVLGSLLSAAWLALALFAVPGCGGDSSEAIAPGPQPGEGTSTRMPQWRAVMDEAPSDHSRLVVRCEAPARTRFRVEAPMGADWLGPWRELKTGQILRVRWAVETDEPGPESLEREDVAAGRTEAHGISLRAQYAGEREEVFRYVLGTRPGRGRTLTLRAVPPGRYEALPAADEGPVRARVELATAVVTDLAAGAATLRARDDGNRVVLPPQPEGASPRVHAARLFLEFAPPAAPP